MSDVFLAPFTRYLWNGPNLLVVWGDSGPLMQGLDAYHARYDLPSPTLAARAVLQRALAGAGAAAISLAEREHWGWSLTFPGTETGLFIGAEPEGMMVIREKPAAHGQGKGLVQRHKPPEAVTQSSFLLRDTDPLHAVETYFNEVLQTETRLAYADGRIAFATALPGGDLGALRGLDDTAWLAELTGLVRDEHLQKLSDVLLFYACRCDDEMILNMVMNLPAATRRELWGEESELHIECPRCGRRYTIERRQV